MRNIRIGSLGEAIAEKFLKNKDYYLLARNFKWLCGEIDLIFLNKETVNEIIFVEVKTRTGEKYGEIEESLTHKKKKRIRKSVLKFLKTVFTRHIMNIRVDFLAVKLDLNKRKAKISHFKNI